MSITMEDNYVYSSADMGDSHVKAHAKQHNYMQDNEPEIIMLNNNSALNVAIDNGVKTKDEWIKYNSKLRKGRQKKNYDEYLRALSANLLKNKKRYVQTSHKVPLSKAKKQMTYQEINSIEKNKFGVTGNLFYLSNVDDYEKQTDLKTYRKFEKDTFETFYKSDTFKKLHPQNFKAEIDFDEKGAMHLQTGDNWMYTDSKGRVSSARRKIIKDILINDLGSEDNLNKQLDVLSDCHKYVKDHKQKKEGDVRADAYFAEMLEHYNGDLSKVDCPKARASERSVRIEELWRLKNMWALKEIAKQKAKQYGVNYDIKDSMYYKTDGVHRSASEYEMQQGVKQKSKDLDTQKEEQDKIAKKLAERDKDVTQRENQVTQRENRVSDLEDENIVTKLELQGKEKRLDARDKEVTQRENIADNSFINFRKDMLVALYPQMANKRVNTMAVEDIVKTTNKDTGAITKETVISHFVRMVKYYAARSAEKTKRIFEAVETSDAVKNIDWNARFGSDSTKVAKPVNKVKKQVQQDDDLER